MNKLIKVVILIFMPLALSAKVAANLNQFDWLQGTWHFDMGDKIAVERWQKVSPISFDGLGSTIKKSTKDTLVFESLRLLKMGDQIFYLAYVKQNPAPVAFKLTAIKGDSAFFENPNHDFPKKIVYIKTGTSTFTAYVSGGDKDNVKAFSLYFKKVDN